jgi:2,4-dienoyl-CoA reductase-like NADH-dependent reductase (Old Yellow Enzyme family)
MVTRLSGEDGHINDDVRNRYLRYARGGVGLMVVEAMAVHQAKSGPLLRLGSDDFVAEHARLAADVHGCSPSKIVPQIIHFLKISRSGWRQTVDMLEPAEIDGIVDSYGAAAVRARQAGYDGVELHMAHAYTLSSFLSKRNRRRDEYGGSLENRLRLPTRVVERVRKEVGGDFCIGIRYDGEECIKGGYSSEEGRVIGVRLAMVGADYLSISAGGKFEDAQPREGEPLYPYTGYSGDRCMPGAAYPDGFNRPIAAAVKGYLLERGLGTAVVSAGKIGTPALAEEILTGGEADLVGMARPLLADPDWPRKVRAGEWDRVVRCCYANVCKALDENFQRVRCFLWPKGELQAPESDDRVAPVWPVEGAGLRAAWLRGKVSLKWHAATDNQQVYGYDVWRREGSGGVRVVSEAGELEAVGFRRLTAVPGGVCAFMDLEAVAGEAYWYAVVAYDLAGNRGKVSELCRVGESEDGVSPGGGSGGVA